MALTPAQAIIAGQLYARAQRERERLTGPWLAARKAGILSAVKAGRVGNSRFGRSLHASRGGRVMALHGAHILAAISPAGVRASAMARRRNAR